ncbi:MAG: hypothetical protein HY975_04475 [Candidatus Kerfeldbacteria bacterium]|nr:hypothetical protein [Candidatus Kerfeldbacteria bacterium]
MAHDSTSAVNRGPTPGDVIIIPHHRGWSVVWPYFTATMAGDTLCRHLYGSDAELALSRLGLHDQSPYDLTVTTVTIVFNRRGRQIGQPNISAPMDKTTFDQHFGAVISCPSVPFLLQPPTPPR